MPVAQTSIECYHSLDLTHQQERVLEAVAILGETCIADIAAYLNAQRGPGDSYWEKSSVSGRLNELKNMDPPAIIKVGEKEKQYNAPQK